MKRLDYEAPTMEEIVVEMENGFLGGSVVTKSQNATIDNHSIETNFSLDGTDTDNFADGEWIVE